MSTKPTDLDIWKTSEAIGNYIKNMLHLCRDVAAGRASHEQMRSIESGVPRGFNEDVLILFGQAFAAEHRPSRPINPLRHGEHVCALRIARDAFFALQDAANGGRIYQLPDIARQHEKRLAQVDLTTHAAEADLACQLMNATIPQPRSPQSNQGKGSEVTTKNKDRDEWIVEQSTAGRSLNEIKDALAKQNPDWERICTPQGIRAGLKRRGNV